MTKDVAIIILGAAMWPDGPSPALVRRTRHGAALFHAGRAGIIVPCGGLGAYPPTEAAAMAHLLIGDGVPTGAILAEDQSTSTYQNLRNAQVILNRRGIDRIIIVTDSFHTRRAMMAARALGFRARADAPAPSTAPLAQKVRRLTHEALATLGYHFRMAAWIRRDQQDQTWARNIS